MKYLLLSLLVVRLTANESIVSQSCDELEVALNKEPCANSDEGAVSMLSVDGFSTCTEAQRIICPRSDAIAPELGRHICQDRHWKWMKQCAIPARFGAMCTCDEYSAIGTASETANTSRELQNDVSNLVSSLFAIPSIVLCWLSLGLFCFGPGSPAGGVCTNSTIDNQTIVVCEGRPMWDDENNLVVAPAQICDADSIPSWSSDPRVADGPTTKKSNEHASIPTERTADRADRWARRAVAEHASIASFASFVINLMTHQAPPHLIRSALLAAQDELEHATMSFTVASLLHGDGRNIEPGPLPLAALSFSQNLTAFGIATASEGCIDETVSALLLADEVAGVTSHWDLDAHAEDKADLETRIVEATGKMANDEGNHATLAWKTIVWVCQSDEKACTSIEEVLLRSANSGESIPTSNSLSVRRAFDQLIAKLVPFVMRGETSFPPNMCEKYNTHESARPLALPQLNADALANRIMEQVFCETITEQIETKQTAQE